MNVDGIVNEADYIVTLNNLTNSVKSPDSYLLGDVNPDGEINANDLGILLDHNNHQAGWHAEQRHRNRRR